MRFILVTILLLLSGCATSTLVSQGPKWSLKGKCEVMHKTDYKDSHPEQKCGIVFEMVLVKGGQ